MRRLLLIVALFGAGAACTGISPSEPAADAVPRSWTDGWEAATGDCDRQLPYGHSAVLVEGNGYMEASYKASYYDGYVDSWQQGIRLGYCDDLEYSGVARGATFLSAP